MASRAKVLTAGPKKLRKKLLVALTLCFSFVVFSETQALADLMDPPPVTASSPNVFIGDPDIHPTLFLCPLSANFDKVSSRAESRHVLWRDEVEGSRPNQIPPLACPVKDGALLGRDDIIPVQTLILEAVSEGYEGMVAVAEVIRNRAKLFHKDFESICLMPKQFSCWNDKTHAEDFLKQNQDYYALALKAWNESEKSFLTQGATDYHTSSVHPYWADAYERSARIGNHVFYVRK